MIWKKWLLSKHYVRRRLLLLTWPADRWVESFVKSLPSKSLLRAVDTLLHGCIAATSIYVVIIFTQWLNWDVHCLTWEGISLRKEHHSKYLSILLYCLIAFGCGCILDIDHVLRDLYGALVSGSRVSWERGFLHYFLPPLLFTLFAYIVSVSLKDTSYMRVGALVGVSTLSHLIRDGLHHGLWLQPFGVTDVLEYWLYVLLTMTLPYLFVIVINLSSRLFREYGQLVIDDLSISVV